MWVLVILGCVCVWLAGGIVRQLWVDWTYRSGAAAYARRLNRREPVDGRQLWRAPR